MPNDTSSDGSDRAVPAWIPPMKAVPTDEVPAGDGWAAEMKWDGMRIQAATDGQRTVLRSSTGRDVTSSFPELDDLGTELGVPAVIDGEVVVFDGDRPSFGHLQHRIHVTDPTPTLTATYPVVYLVFDLLELDGQPVVDLPYLTRRGLLTELLPDHPRWHASPFVLDGAADMLTTARHRRMEGIVVKRTDSPYRVGARSRDWLKAKVRLHQEFVVGGWLGGQGELVDQIGSLMVGVWEGDELVMAGRVGSGLTDAERHRLSARFVDRPDPPFCSVPALDRRPGWVEPTTVVEVGFSEWPDDGLIRHPTYLGIRTDRDPSDVVREDASWFSSTEAADPAPAGEQAQQRVRGGEP